MLQSSQPFERPDAAFHSPVVPDGIARRVGAVPRLVVGEEGMDLVDRIGVPSRRARVADGRVAEVLAGVSVRVGQRGPVVLADRVRLDEDEVPVRFGVVGRPERQALGSLPRLTPVRSIVCIRRLYVRSARSE